MSKAYLVLSPHQDDELLTLGISAVRAMQKGYDTYIALITDGRASNVKKRLGMDTEEFVAARDEEFRASCLAIGYQESNILVREGDQRVSDGQLTPQTAAEQIRYFIASLPEGYDKLVLATISPHGSKTQHKDHRALGEAALSLYRSHSDRASLGITRLDLFLEPYEYAKLDDTRYFSCIELKSVAPITQSAESYRNSTYGIAFLSVPRELEAFLDRPVAYRDRHNERLFDRKIATASKVAKKNLVKTARASLSPVDDALSHLKCRKVRFEPKMLEDPEYTTCVDYIYNRPDLFTDSYEAFEIVFAGKKYLIEVLYEEDKAELCIRLSKIPKQVATILCDCIFKRHPEVQRILMKQVFFELGKASKTNHIKVVLPETVEELNDRLPNHTRSEIRRRLRHLNADHGQVRFVEYGREDIAESIVTAFFEFKRKTHGREYGMSPEEYLDYYHVSHAYVLYVEDSIVAVRFLCEQCSTVNAENLSYDDRYSTYSPGILIHQFALERLVEKGKKQIFLGNGHQGQKLMFGSIDEQTWNCTMHREKRSREESLPFVKMAVAGVRRRKNKALESIKLKRSVEASDTDKNIYREVFFSTRRKRVKPLPSAIEGASFMTVRSVEELEAFAMAYGSSLDKINVFRIPDSDLDKQKSRLKKKISDRLSAGSTFSALCNEGLCLSSGWLTVGQKFYISEIDASIDMEKSSCGILYDFFTEPETRGLGLYPHLLGKMMEEALGEGRCDSFIIYTSEKNVASSRGIQKAGFRHDGSFTHESVIPYLEKFEIATVGANS